MGNSFVDGANNIDNVRDEITQDKFRQTQQNSNTRIMHEEQSGFQIKVAMHIKSEPWYPSHLLTESSTLTLSLIPLSRFHTCLVRTFSVT